MIKIKIKISLRESIKKYCNLKRTKCLLNKIETMIKRIDRMTKKRESIILMMTIVQIILIEIIKRDQGLDQDKSSILVIFNRKRTGTYIEPVLTYN